MIPKVIHYCWFGRNPLPEEAKKCIASWKKFCPDYEIKEWNEDNYDINACSYIKEAYQQKKWAFVSDYARFDILYRYGGIYFDTDVELICHIDDIVEAGPFMGMEIGDAIVVAPGLGLGVYAQHQIYKEILEFYKKCNFLNVDGSLNTTTVVAYTTNILEKYGLKKKEEIQCVEDIYIYPAEFFSPMNYATGEINITNNTRSIHHYTSSWLSEEELRIHRFQQRMRKKYGKKTAQVLERIYSFPYRIRRKLAIYGIKGTVRIISNKVKKRIKN